MAKVKEFAAKVLAEIEAALKERAPIRDIGTLGEYQTEKWFLELLMNDLKDRLGVPITDNRDKEVKDRLASEAEKEVSESTLRLFVTKLTKNYKFIWNTNCLYNYAPTSAETIVSEILARNLHEMIKSEKHQHHYDYLFPGFPCSRFTSSTGRFQDMPLKAFIWTSQGYPIEVVACLDNYHAKINSSLSPRHCCLKEADCPNGLRLQPELTEEETTLLASHSPQANEYYFLIANTAPEEDIAKARQSLVDAINRKDFIPSCNIPNSDKTLLANGVLNDFNVTSLDKLSNLLSRIKPKDWPGLMLCLDNDTLDAMMLPKTLPTEKDPGGRPDISIFRRDGNEAKLKEFVENPNWYVLREHVFNTASLYLLAELFIRMRKREGKKRAGQVGEATGYGATDENKIAALKFFQRFLLSGRCLNQLEEYAKANGAYDTEYAWLTEGRTALLSQKAESLWVELIKLGALEPFASPEVGVPPAVPQEGVLMFDAQTLRADARFLCGFKRDKWEDEVKKRFPPARLNSFQSYVKTFQSPPGFLDRVYKVKDDLLNCVRCKAHYVPGDHNLNRAVIYLFVHYYEFYRELGFSHTSTVGKLIGAPEKKAKLAGAGVLKKFLRSEMDLNCLREFLEKEEGMAEHLAALLDDMSPNSELKAIAEQTVVVYSPSFTTDPEPVPAEEAPPSVIWNYLPSLPSFMGGGSK